MRVLVVQNFDNEGLGQIGAALDEAGADIDLRRPYRGESLPHDSGAHDAMVVLGGAQNALDDEICPYFPGLLDLTRDFAGKDRAVLGICLGSQLIARAFGGENQIGGASEFGWHRVSLTPAAKTDPVLAALPENFPIFEWHDDTFVLPRKCRAAGRKRCRREPGVPHRPRHLRLPVPFRGGSPDGARMEHVVRIAHRRAASRLEHRLETRWPATGQADAAGLAIARAWVATI